MSDRHSGTEPPVPHVIPRDDTAQAAADLAASAAAAAAAAELDDADIDAALAGTSQATGLMLSDRIYLIARVATTVALVAAYAIDRVRVGSLGRVNEAMLLTGLALFAVVGVSAVVARLAFKRSQTTVLMVSFPVDLLAAALLIASTGAYEDPIYPWMLFLAVAYAAVFAGRRGWVISGVTAAVYFAASVLGQGRTHSSGSLVFLAFNAVALVFIGSVTASAVMRQARHEEWLRASQRDVFDLNELLSRRLGELRAVSEITDVIHSTLDFDMVGANVLDILSRVLELPSAALFVIDSGRDETVFSASSGISPTAAEQYSQAHAFGRPLETAPDELFECETVLDHNGLLVVFCATGDRLARLSTEDRLVLQAVASELVVAVENSQLYKLTKRLSITDELTGLYNYRYLQQRLDDEIERARRYRRALSLLMIDADDFKIYNDTYGHLAGDVALAEIGGVLRSSVRDIDVACRYGGEEFAIVLPETDASGAFVVAEKAREAIADHLFLDGEGDRTVTLTVSIGLSSYPSVAADREALLKQADEALYQAKRRGRDRVCAPAESAAARADDIDATGAVEGTTT